MNRRSFLRRLAAAAVGLLLPAKAEVQVERRGPPVELTGLSWRIVRLSAEPREMSFVEVGRLPGMESLMRGAL